MNRYLAAWALSLLLLVAGCSSGTYSRGQFTGFVLNATEDQVESKIGKPAQVDAKDPVRPRWIYNAKTFDPDNLNKVDEKVIVIFEKNAEGKLVGKDIIFG